MRLGILLEDEEGSGQVSQGSRAPPPESAELARRRVPDSHLTLAGETLTCSVCVAGAHFDREFTVWETCCRWSLWGHLHPTSCVVLAFPPSLLPQAWVGPIVCARLGQLWGLSAHFPSDAGPTC